MLRTSLNQSAKNSPSSIDGTEDADVGSGTSSITRSAKNLPSNMAEHAKVGGNSDGGDDETVEKSPLSKKLNRLMEYFTSLCSDADSAPFKKR